MKVVVCTKQTPSTEAVYNVEGDQVTWQDPGGKPKVVNPWDDFAIEEAIRFTENHGAEEAIALTIGDEGSADILKTALAMGCTAAVRVDDEGLAGSGGQGTARVLAAAIEKNGAAVALFGKQAIDGDTGMTPVMTARALGWTALTYVSAVVAVDESTITVERMLERGVQTVTAALPVVISVVKEINEPRYPSFMGIRKANKAEIPVWSAADLDIDGAVGAASSKVDWSNITMPPKRVAETEIITGDSAADIAKQVADKLIAEKVI